MLSTFTVTLWERFVLLIETLVNRLQLGMGWEESIVSVEILLPVVSCSYEGRGKRAYCRMCNFSF